MALNKTQKQKILEELKEKITRQKAIVFADFSGLKIKDLSALRKKVKCSDCELKVAKKTLISLALKKEGIEINLKKMEGEIVLCFGYKDEVLPFKILYDFSKEKENLKILGGLIGEETIEKEKAIEIAQLPTKKELLAKIVGSIKTPILSLVNVLQGNLRNLVLVLKAIQIYK